MVIRNSFPTGSPTGLPVLDTRNLVAGLAFQASDGPRTGVLPSPGVLGGVVTGTGQMMYNVASFQAITSSAVGGAELVANDGTVAVATTAAPAANARIDLIFVRARFAAAGAASDVPEIGVVQGAVAPIASVQPPATPAGAVVLATARVSAGATSTLSSSVVISSAPRLTTLQGGILTARNAAELVDGSATNGALAVTLDDGALWSYRGTRWRRSASVPITAKCLWTNATSQSNTGVVTLGGARYVETHPLIDWDLANFRCIPRIPGKYIFQFYGQLNNNGSGLRQWSISKNGPGSDPQIDFAKSAAPAYPLGNGAAQLTLEADMDGSQNFVTWNVFQDTGSPLNVQNAWIQVRYLGPLRDV